MDESEVIHMAKRIAQEEGWIWVEPVRVELIGEVWILRTNYHERGQNIQIEIIDSTGKVLTKRFNNR